MINKLHISKGDVYMAYISSFVYCDNIQQQGVQPNGNSIMQILNPLQVIKPIALPSNFSFSVMCIVSGFETQEEHLFNLIFKSPSGEVLQNTGDIPIKIPQEIVGNSKKLNAVQICMDFRNVVIKEYGDHVAEISINGNTIGKFMIPVIQGEENV